MRENIQKKIYIGRMFLSKSIASLYVFYLNYKLLYK